MQHPALELISLHYPPEPTGNAPYVGALAVQLAKRGYEVEAHVGHPHYPEWKFRDGYGGWTTHENADGVAITRRWHYLPQPPRGLRRLMSEVSFGLRIACGRRRRAQVTVAASPALFSTAVLALQLKLSFRRTPFVVWVQDLYTLGLRETGQGSGLVGRLTRWVESRVLRSADRVVVIHQRFAEYVVEELGVDRESVLVIRNWTHLQTTGPVDIAATRAALGWPSQGILAVHAGNMGVKQGLENLVDAARLADERAEDVTFVMIGDGSERQTLERRAHGVQRIMFVDPLDASLFPLALRAADVLIVNEKPGVSEMSVPSKLTSYFDAMKPVVAAVGLEGITASEILASGAGRVVGAGNPIALLDGVLGVGADSEAAAALGHAGLEYRRTVLEQNVAIDAWIALLDQLV